MSLLEVRELRKSYNGTVAVDGLSFTVLAGEVLGLLGPNGAGKTTTMSMIAGLLSPERFCWTGARSTGTTNDDAGRSASSRRTLRSTRTSPRSKTSTFSDVSTGCGVRNWTIARIRCSNELDSRRGVGTRSARTRVE